jgi:hypothetical protein
VCLNRGGEPKDARADDGIEDKRNEIPPPETSDQTLVGHLLHQGECETCLWAITQKGRQRKACAPCERPRLAQLGDVAPKGAKANTDGESAVAGTSYGRAVVWIRLPGVVRPKLRRLLYRPVPSTLT